MNKLFLILPLLFAASSVAIPAHPWPLFPLSHLSPTTPFLSLQHSLALLDIQPHFNTIRAAPASNTSQIIVDEPFLFDPSAIVASPTMGTIFFIDQHKKLCAYEYSIPSDPVTSCSERKMISTPSVTHLQSFPLVVGRNLESTIDVVEYTPQLFGLAGDVGFQNASFTVIKETTITAPIIVRGEGNDGHIFFLSPSNELNVVPYRTGQVGLRRTLTAPNGNRFLTMPATYSRNGIIYLLAVDQNLEVLLGLYNTRRYTCEWTPLSRVATDRPSVNGDDNGFAMAIRGTNGRVESVTYDTYYKRFSKWTVHDVFTKTVPAVAYFNSDKFDIYTVDEHGSLVMHRHTGSQTDKDEWTSISSYSYFSNPLVLDTTNASQVEIIMKTDSFKMTATNVQW